MCVCVCSFRRRDEPAVGSSEPCFFFFHFPSSCPCGYESYTLDFELSYTLLWEGAESYTLLVGRGEALLPAYH